MTMPRLSHVRRLVALVFVALAAALTAAAAHADIIVSRDNDGRPITFDVRTAGTDVEWYAAVLRAAAHGNEIATATIRIVPPEDISLHCGASAAACYGTRGGSATIVVPAGRDDGVARLVLHEYGHHVDQAWFVDGVSEPNGIPSWWAARKMAELLGGGLVAFDYSLGWSRSIGEIFAEDYAYIHLPARYGIPWLPPPDDTLRSILLAGLAGSPPTPPTTQAPPPVVVIRRGALAPRARRTVPFRLLGPGRRVTLTATVAGTGQTGRRARLELVCGQRRVATTTFVRGRQTRTLDVPGLGPAACEARLLSTSRASNAYTLRLRLSLEGGTT